MVSLARSIAQQRRFGDPYARFWSKIDFLSDSDCWIFSGAKDRSGYGLSSHPETKKMTGAHRIAWEIEHGKIPNGMYILHSCDNPACVRPDHLILGTQKDNIEDMLQKGRAKYQKDDEKFLVDYYAKHVDK